MKAIREWSPPKNVSGIRSFHGLARFYKRFMKEFNTLAAPLNEIVKKDVSFKWGEKQEKAFASPKENLTKNLFLPCLIFLNLLKLNVMQLMWELEFYFVSGRSSNCLL